MAYVHNGREPVILVQNPIDADGTDWIYFVYGSPPGRCWLRTGETILAGHTALITGGTIVTQSTYIGTVTGQDGVTYYEVYGVQFSVSAGAQNVAITHRVSTTLINGAVDLGRLNIDHTGIVEVVVA